MTIYRNTFVVLPAGNISLVIPLNLICILIFHSQHCSDLFTSCCIIYNIFILFDFRCYIYQAVLWILVFKSMTYMLPVLEILKYIIILLPFTSWSIYEVVPMGFGPWGVLSHHSQIQDVFTSSDIFTSIMIWKCFLKCEGLSWWLTKTIGLHLPRKSACNFFH